MKTVFIYALNCPVTGAVRYVGKTNNPARRYADHLVSKEKCHRGNWVRSVLATDEKPVMEILDEVLDSEWPMWEVAYIQFFREEGCNLVNSTSGGEGIEPTLETRAKLSVAKSGEKHHFFGKKLSPEHCAKMSAASLGKSKSAEHRAKIGAANLGKKRSPEDRASMSVVRLGRKRSLETRAKISAATAGEKNPNFGRKHSVETRAKMKAYWASRRASAK